MHINLNEENNPRHSKRVAEREGSKKTENMEQKIKKIKSFKNLMEGHISTAKREGQSC
jgi:hypothetical protein